jgi:hypothetical protein
MKNNSSNLLQTENEVIFGSYEIQYDKPIATLTNIFVEAFEVVNRSKCDEHGLYVLIYNKALPIRWNLFAHFRRNLLHNMVVPIEYDVVHLNNSGSDHFIAILQRPALPTLSQYLEAKSWDVSLDFLINTVIRPITKLLHNIHQAGLIHGCINPDNIFISEDGEAILAECVSTTVGFNQLDYYEPLERAECMPIGKADNYPAADFYALGVVCLRICLGKSFDEIVNNTGLTAERYRTGSFNTMVPNKVLVPSVIRDIIHGLLMDRPIDRYNAHHLEEWLEGKKQTLIAASEISASRSLIFNAKRINNLRSLSYELSRNWNLARVFVQEEEFYKWLDKGIASGDLADQIIRMVHNSFAGGGQAGDFLIRTLMLLDFLAPIRIRDIALEPNAVNNFIAYALYTKRKEYLDAIPHFIMTTVWYNSETLMSAKVGHGISFNVERAKRNIYSNGFGAGIERCLYDLNPGMPCQSPMVHKKYIQDLKTLLLELEQIAVDKNTNIVDRHVIAFIASALESNMDNTWRDLRHYEKAEDNIALATIVFLSAAQQQTRIPTLYNISSHVVNSLINNMISGIHNKSLKLDLATRLIKIASQGNLKLILDFMIVCRDFDIDKQRFKLAKKKFKQLANKLVKLDKDSQISKEGYKIGLRITLIVSYIVFLISFVLSMRSILL